MSDAAESIDTSEAVEASPAANDAVPPSGQQQPGETAAQARARIKVGDEELDDATYIDRLREALGPEALANIGGLAKVARSKVSTVGKQEHQLRRAVEDLKDPRRVWDVLDRIHPGKLRSLMEERYAQFLEDDSVPPEEREKKGLQGEIERMRAEKKALEDEKRERAATAMREQLVPQFGRDFTTALKGCGADADPEMLGAMAAYVEQELDSVQSEADYRALVGEAARAVARKYGDGVMARIPKLPKDKRIAALKETLREMSYDELIDALGVEGARKFRAGDIERAKRPAQPAARPAVQASGSRPATREKQSLDDFFATIRNGDKL